MFKLFVLAFEAVKGTVISFFSMLYKHALKNIPCPCNIITIRGQEVQRAQVTYQMSLKSGDNLNIWVVFIYWVMLLLTNNVNSSFHIDVFCYSSASFPLAIGRDQEITLFMLQ